MAEKGVGRFMWLKAFSKAEIHSTFEQSGLQKRHFIFSLGQELTDVPAQPSSGERKTVVALREYSPPYKDEAPRSLDILAQRIVEHCLPYFLDATCPSVTLTGPEGDTLDLNHYFGEYIGDRAAEHHFEVADNAFTLRGVRLYHVRDRQHALIYAANSREVEDTKLSRHIPALPSRLDDEAGEPFVYLAFLTGSYLDANVTPERTGFNFPNSADEVQTVLPMVTLEDIRNAALPFVKKDLSEFIAKANQQKAEQIEAY